MKLPEVHYSREIVEPGVIRIGDLVLRQGDRADFVLCSNRTGTRPYVEVTVRRAGRLRRTWLWLRWRVTHRSQPKTASAA